MGHIIMFASGTVPVKCDALDTAKDYCSGLWPEAEFEECPDGRTLVWEDEESSIDDDGSKAVAMIIRTTA